MAICTAYKIGNLFYKMDSLNVLSVIQMNAKDFCRRIDIPKKNLKMMLYNLLKLNSNLHTFEAMFTFLWNCHYKNARNKPWSSAINIDSDLAKTFKFSDKNLKIFQIYFLNSIPSVAWWKTKAKFRKIGKVKWEKKVQPGIFICLNWTLTMVFDHCNADYFNWKLYIWLRVNCQCFVRCEIEVFMIKRHVLYKEIQLYD